MRLIVGLGNPGQEYEKTRHNAGFLAVDRLAGENNLDWRLEKKVPAYSARLGDNILLKPQTFMNESGRAIAAFFTYYHCSCWSAADKAGNLPLDLKHCLFVIHDDLDIDLGDYRMSDNSRSAGHKGVQSIIDLLGTKSFIRFRLGIKTEKSPRLAAEKYVLENFLPAEEKLLNQAIASALAKILN